MTIEEQGCQYKSDGTNAGRLFCPNKQICCSGDSAKSKKEGMLKCRSRISFHATVFLQFLRISPVHRSRLFSSGARSGLSQYLPV